MQVEQFRQVNRGLLLMDERGQVWLTREGKQFYGVLLRKYGFRLQEYRHWPDFMTVLRLIGKLEDARETQG